MPCSKAITTDQQRIKDPETRIDCFKREKTIKTIALLMLAGIERTR